LLELGKAKKFSLLKRNYYVANDRVHIVFERQRRKRGAQEGMPAA
jgi:hypothetical protein